MLLSDLNDPPVFLVSVHIVGRQDLEVIMFVRAVRKEQQGNDVESMY